VNQFDGCVLERDFNDLFMFVRFLAMLTVMLVIICMILSLFCVYDPIKFSTYNKIIIIIVGVYIITGFLAIVIYGAKSYTLYSKDGF
jgi:hypothetical protein